MTSGTDRPGRPHEREATPMDEIALVGDGFDDIRLLDAGQVSGILQLPKKSVYELPIEKVRLRERTVRWRAEDVRDFVESRREAA